MHAWTRQFSERLCHTRGYELVSHTLINLLIYFSIFSLSLLPHVVTFSSSFHQLSSRIHLHFRLRYAASNLAIALHLWEGRVGQTLSLYLFSTFGNKEETIGAQKRVT
jgi:NADH:ubiquinone oxidoreductase subunit K